MNTMHIQTYSKLHTYLVENTSIHRQTIIDKCVDLIDMCTYLVEKLYGRI